MPVGTKGAIKGSLFIMPSFDVLGLTTQEMENIGCRILLGNTYHLALKPTGDLLDTFGGKQPLIYEMSTYFYKKDSINFVDGSIIF